MNDAVRTESLDSPLVLSREQDVVAEFLNCYRDSSFRIAMRVLGNVDAAEDVAQEALIRAFKSWDRLASVDRQAAWVRKVVVRCALNALERTPRYSELPDMTPCSQDGEQSVMVQAVLDTLIPDQRLILGLSIGEGLSYQEIAEVLDIPTGTVASRLNTAKAAFRKAWEGTR
jgi:RNA polymerase sigma factor (sigma-70 family)